MKKTIYFPLALFLFLTCVHNSLFAQNTSDALRLSLPGFSLNARSLGMGNAFTGVANDFSATYWNPAGIGMIENSEMTFSLSHTTTKDNSTYLENSTFYDNTSTNLDNVGFIFPFPTTQGSFVMALGYSKVNNYNAGLQYAGFNTQSSIINDWAPAEERFSYFPTSSYAYQLWLANVESTMSGNDWEYFYNSPIRKNLSQKGTLLENGGMNLWSVSASFEAAPELFLGATLNIIRGTYNYSNEYTEQDTKNYYSLSATPGYDFDYLRIEETIKEDIGGYNMILGMFYNFMEDGSFGISLHTPSYLSLRDDFRILRESSINSKFYTYDDPENITDPANFTEFEIATPFVFSFGASYRIQNFLLSASSEFTDWTQMEFTNITPDLEYLNRKIKETYRSALSYHLGMEYYIPYSTMIVRGGYMYLPSAYKKDPTSFDKKYITLGASFTLEESIVIDIAYANGNWNSFTDAPNVGYTIQEKITTHNIFATIAYRY
jgi:hypothetical protein